MCVHKCRVSYAVHCHPPRKRLSDSVHACGGDMHIGWVSYVLLCDRQQVTHWLASTNEIGVYW